MTKVPAVSSPRQPLQSGMRFGRLVVLSELPERRRASRVYRCLCDCGNTVDVVSTSLRNSNTRSCGCLRNDPVVRERQSASASRNIRHGHARRNQSDPTHNSWENMKRRCLSPRYKRYAQYGGRGIKICDRWLGPDGFPNFLADMGKRPQGLTLDRVNVDGNYEPGNCRWATNLEQQRNRQPTGPRKTNTSGFHGVTHSAAGGWQAEIRYDGHRRYLGYYPDALAAGRAVEAFRRTHVQRYKADLRLDPLPSCACASCRAD